VHTHLLPIAPRPSVPKLAPPGWLDVNVSVSREFVQHIFPVGALTLLVGRQEGHPVCETLGLWFVDGDSI